MVIPGERPFFPPETGNRGAPDPLIRILVVDDQPSLRRSVVALLQGDDRLIEDCGSVAETLVRLGAASYDLIILDYRLPDATGLAVMNWLSSHHRNESVIVISGEDSMEAAIAALRRGAQDFLRKPYDPDQLRRAVQSVLGKRQQERSHRLTLQRLQSSEHMHRYLVESSPDLIFTTTPDGRFNYINPRIESLLGYRRNSLIGQHFSEIVHPEDLERTRQTFHERRTGQRAAANVEVRLTRSPFGPDQDGEAGPLPFVLNAHGIYHDEDGTTPGEYLGTYGVARHAPPLRLTALAGNPPLQRDPLTRLPGRELLFDRLDLAVAQAKRRKGQIAVMQVDVDRFKDVNERFGQGEGDTLLCAIARRLQRCLRRGDTLSRQGGDEFTILLPDVRGKDNAQAIAGKIHQAFEQPFSLGKDEVRLNCSIGVALYPEDGDDAESLTQHAAIAMFQAKRNGGESHEFFEPGMHSAYRARISLETELRLAISNRELELFYQPRVSLSRNQVTGMEALIRWRHRNHGLVAPSRFLQLAEEVGIMPDISRWVLETACAQLSAWRRLYPELRLATNLSLRDFDRADLNDAIYKALAQHNLPPDSLELEITENLLLEDHEFLAAKVQGLRDMGVGLSIDDFGTGLSSLSLLHRFPVTRLKIDRSFVRNINGQGSHPVINAITGIARGFDVQVSAEGVERGDQVSVLETAGCDEMQGYFFSKPLGAEAATRMLQDFRPAAMLQTAPG
ncbi:MAG TPA: EAL domain-containing protein [Zoogloea sp.]|uniref:putative bifunctional diguanylate cyclase/phosphodiesterase n=1 Tax=Zoogloea sp. TaxID=49181 RepID=UPI002C5FB6B1|nr:EAL domain-containing protein [Zoogloea sp.]HMV17521.1 EAL domain-containing protein [Rhodocyclaceae bacterium]HMV62997.1 EAL domain-containing protein [Rhodocyclaceae bacterium]HMW52788.1 EAL domain-containing protein [Rhodocyclaceae bacterium]HMZ75328.1 EAL domain-containing protein [Rhodocyclaceae bacterium]HNA67521.1 EAL domain-containing protein [Rhodocyclaceae bacterium]